MESPFLLGSAGKCKQVFVVGPVTSHHQSVQGSGAPPGGPHSEYQQKHEDGGREAGDEARHRPAVRSIRPGSQSAAETASSTTLLPSQQSSGQISSLTVKSQYVMSAISGVCYVCLQRVCVGTENNKLLPGNINNTTRRHTDSHN